MDKLKYRYPLIQTRKKRIFGPVNDFLAGEGRKTDLMDRNGGTEESRPALTPRSFVMAEPTLRPQQQSWVLPSTDKQQLNLRDLSPSL